jgi:hypothetical protein
VYHAGFDLKNSPITPFHDEKYNFPSEIQDKIRWGMGIQGLSKILDLWAKMLDNYGIKIVSITKDYKESLKHPLGNNECSMEK